jgi:pyridoxal 5'-phosphate synthase pdxT subunit
VNIGVLALQGASARHAAMVARLGADPVAVRAPAQLDQLDALIIPGGESTTISMLLESSGLFDPLAARLQDGLPVMGTCAGMILLASDILDGRDDQRCFGVLDAAVRRNAFGRQVDSFEADLAVAGIASMAGTRGRVGGTGNGSPVVAGDDRFHAVFIRAPVVERVGPDVEVMARVGDRPVLCRQGRALATAFHPELGDDTRLHQLFLRLVNEVS